LSFYFKVSLVAILLGVPSAQAKVCAVVSSFAPMFAARNRTAILLEGPREGFKKENYEHRTNMYEATDSTLDLLKKLDQAIHDGCKVIVGLYTSRECLLAVRQVRDKDVIIMSPACGTDKIKEFTNHIYTGVPSLESYAGVVSDHLQSSSNSIIFVIQKSDIYSSQYYRLIRSTFTAPHSVLDVLRDGSVSKDSLERIQKLEGAKTIVFTVYPKVAIPALSVLFSNHILDSFKRRRRGSATFPASFFVKGELRHF